MPATRRTLLAGLAVPALVTGCHPLPMALPRYAEAAIPAEPHPDAAILAMGPFIAGLATAADRACQDLTAAEELVHELTMPVPVKPRDAQFLPTYAAYREAMRRWEADSRTYTRQVAEAEAATGIKALGEASVAADCAMVEACERLAEQRAVTLDGLILKARFVARDGDDGELIRSIVADLLAMGGTA